MDDEQKHPIWEQWKAIAKEEAYWFAETLGMVTLTLAIGRLIQKLGLDLSHLTGTSWEELVKKWLQQEHKP
ncbi:MAG: hypothetical protein AB7G75_08780 [Candidatus Binatia bacterium]